MIPQPTPITCEYITPLLPGYVGGDLAEDQLRRVKVHLRDCCSCRREGGDYMQANKALQRAATSVVREQDVDFDAMHAEIMQRVYDEEVAAHANQHGVAAAVWPNRLMLVAAAVLLCSFGFWLGADVEPQSILLRPPSVAVGDRGYDAVPYAGTPADIRPVGQRRVGDAEDAGGAGVGMGGRGKLRADVEDLPRVRSAVRFAKKPPVLSPR